MIAIRLLYVFNCTLRVRDLASMTALMRYNNFRHDPLSRCEGCDPPYSAENAISARYFHSTVLFDSILQHSLFFLRCDLNPKNGTYPFGALGHR